LQAAREELEGKVEHQLLRRNPYSLTFRELTVLHKVAAGRSDKEIGAELAISPLTAQKHISNILAKMDAASRTEAAARAIREGLLE
ncbi:MAG: response regulator transcription factor, partial [Chloroflexi bacterium]|nr:response regulator transcription factor [Chloroflexota bacterium]